MVICKFFLQGNCRFGDTCKNEHSYNENPQSVLLKKSEIDINVLIKAVSGDMLKAEKGNQWPLTCYGPFQAKPCFPGFEDKSFEEVRLGYLEAQQNGTLDQYKQQLNQSIQEAQMKIKVLQNPTAEAANVLKKIYNNTQNFQNTSGFTNNPQTNYSNSIFGNAAQTYPNAQSNSIFANANQNFAAPANKSVFGGAAAPQNAFSNSAPPNQSIFSQNAPGQSIFANAANKTAFGASGQSIFGAAPPNQNIFASAATNAPPTQSLFGNVAPNQNIFANPQQNVFASAANAFTSTPSQIYSNAAPSQNVFTSAASGQSVFANSANNFTSAAPSQSVFASSANVFTSAAPSQNVFTSSAPSQSGFASAAQSQSGFASSAPTQGGFVSSANAFTTPGQNIFTSAAPTQNIFTGASSIFSNAQQNFAQNPTPSQSIFGSNAPPNQTFGNIASNPPTNSPFAAAANTNPSANIFQKAIAGLNQNSVFGGAQSHSTNIFGNKPQSVPVAKVDDPTTYSKINELSSDDVVQFESRCFEFGKIPIRPPPLEMC